MVHGYPAAFLLVIFEQREVGYPQEVEGAFLIEVQHLSQMVAQSAQAVEYHLVLVCHDEQHVAFLGAHTLMDGLDLVLGEELLEGRGYTISGEPGEGQTPGTVGLDKVGELVDLLAGQSGGSALDIIPRTL